MSRNTKFRVPRIELTIVDVLTRYFKQKILLTTRLVNFPIGCIIFSNIIALFAAVLSAYKSAVFRFYQIFLFANIYEIPS